MVTMPCGILNAIMVNFGTIFVMKMTPKLKFVSHHTQQHVTVFLIFIVSYLSLGILILTRYNERMDDTHLPGDFTKDWLIFYS